MQISVNKNRGLAPVFMGRCQINLPLWCAGASGHHQRRNSPENQRNFPVDMGCFPFHWETPFFANVLSCEIVPGSPPLRFGLRVPFLHRKITKFSQSTHTHLYSFFTLSTSVKTATFIAIRLQIWLQSPLYLPEALLDSPSSRCNRRFTASSTARATALDSSSRTTLTPR